MSHAHTPGSDAASEKTQRDSAPSSTQQRLEEVAQTGGSATPRERQLLSHNAVLVQLSCSQAIANGDVSAAFDEITKAAAVSLDVARVGIWLYSDDRKRIRCQNLYERAIARHTAGLELKAADYPEYFRAIDENRTIAADDVIHDPRTREFNDVYLLPLKITSMIDAPVRLGGKLIGLVCHEHIGPMRHWTVEEQAFAGSIADFVALSMQAAERRQAQNAVLESERRLRLIIDLVPHMIFVTDRSGRFLLANQAVADTYGTTVEKLLGRDHASVHPSDSELAKMLADKQEVIRTGRPKYTAEQVFTDWMGEARTVQLTTIPFDDPASNRQATLSVAIDITELKRAQQQQSFMLQELDHRVKNNLAKVLSIAELTMTGSKSLGEFKQAFTGRIHSMAIAHEMLAMSGWRGAELRVIAERVLEPHQHAGQERISLSGPKVVLPHAIAPPLTMILHELATNAVKYGSLSRPQGRVNLIWTFDRTQRMLQLNWSELNGPKVEQPGHRGFGTNFIERTATFQLHGRAELRFDPSGFNCSIVLPLHDDSERREPECEPPPQQQTQTDPRIQQKLSGRRVLVVEDDYLVAQSLAESLLRMGCEIVGPVSNADDGRRLAREGRLDAAILDVNLTPGTSAPVARALAYSDTPFVFITGYSNLRVLPDDLRGHRVLCKPVDSHMLASALGDLLLSR